jgi:YcxB-like protein
MVVEFSYKKSSVINALRLHFLNRGEVRVFRITLIILFACTVVGNLLGVVSASAVLGIFIMMVVILLFFWYLLPVSTYNKSATFKEHIRLQLDDQGMRIGTKNGERLVGWKNFNSVIETKDFYYLYRDKKSFFLIPSDSFNIEDKREFTQMLKILFADYRFVKSK